MAYVVFAFWLLVALQASSHDRLWEESNEILQRQKPNYRKCMHEHVRTHLHRTKDPIKGFNDSHTPTLNLITRVNHKQDTPSAQINTNSERNNGLLLRGLFRSELRILFRWYKHNEDDDGNYDGNYCDNVVDGGGSNKTESEQTKNGWTSWSPSTRT